MTLSPALDDLSAWVVECNCSICARNGCLNVYVQTSCITFETAGLDSAMVEKYSFGKGRVVHYFCKGCGSSLMAESVEEGFYEGVKALNVSLFSIFQSRKLKCRFLLLLAVLALFSFRLMLSRVFFSLGVSFHPAFVSLRSLFIQLLFSLSFSFHSASLFTQLLFSLSFSFHPLLSFRSASFSLSVFFA